MVEEPLDDVIVNEAIHGFFADKERRIAERERKKAEHGYRR